MNAVTSSGDIGRANDPRAASCSLTSGISSAARRASLALAMGFEKVGSKRLFQIGFIDKVIMNGELTERVADLLYDEILRELALARMIERGLEDSQAHRTISDREMRQRIRTWQK